MNFSQLFRWYAAHPWYGGVLVTLLGLCVGSFLNVCIYRIPNKLSIRKPPSHCPACKARLGLLDMVPVASWLFLGGKCRHCGGGISPRYAAVELLTGALFLACWWKLPEAGRLAPALALTSVLVVAAFIDAEHTIIPNGLVLFGTAAGLAAFLITGNPPWRDALLGALAGAVPLLAIDVVSRMVLKKDGMGGGDVKLMAMAGLFLGWQGALLALVLAVLAGGLAGAALLITGRVKRGAYFPFGPFLAAGSFASLVFGGNLLQLYSDMNRTIIGWFIG